MNAEITPAAEGPTLPRIAQAVLGQPLLLHPVKAQVIAHVLAGRIGLDAPSSRAVIGPDASRFIGSYRREERDAGLTRATGGVALIPVVGSLVNRGSWIGSNSGLVSYEGLEAQLADAVADPEVQTIVFDLDTPGGEALGAFNLATAIREARASKRIVAYVNDMAASAGYAIAASADEIVVSPSSVVGSIGVVMIRSDFTGAMANDGIKVDVFTAGAYKADGNPFTEMDDDERKRTTALIDRFYSLFVSSVAAGRGDRLSEEQARATEAGIYIGQDAIDAGLADRMGHLRDILKSEQARGAATGQGGITMSNDANTPTGENQIDVDAIARTARAEGAAAERDRISAILTCDAAEGREAQAQALALETDLTPDAAAMVLEKSPKASGADQIAARADGEAEIGANGGSASAEADVDAMWSRALSKLG